VIVSIVSAIHHSVLTWQSQFIDEIGVLQAQVTYFDSIERFSRKQWISLLLCITLGLIHPMFPGIMIFYLFFILAKRLIFYCEKFPEIRWNSMIVVSLNIIALLSGVLDYILCPNYRLLHPIAHIFLSMYCLFGALICYDIKALTK